VRGEGSSASGFCRPDELNYSRILNFGGNYNPDDPAALASAGTVDPNVKNDRTRVEYTLRRALKVSSNRASAQLLQQVGLSPVLDYAHRLGIESQLPAVPSLALGTGGVTLLELTSAYVPFASEGRWVKPAFIRRVEDNDGRVIWSAPYVAHQAIDASTAFLMSSMLRDVIAGGTGYLARSMGFKHAAAGKTGTTDDFADAWFIGYTPRLVTGVWFGFDRPRTIFTGGFAGVVAVPAWTRFMLKATAADPTEWYKQPPDVEKLTICRLSGALATEECRHEVAPVLTSADSPGASTEPPVSEDYFVVGTGPTELCPIHRREPAAFGTSGALQPAALIR
jgi:penicillin-binding protein 1A